MNDGPAVPQIRVAVVEREQGLLDVLVACPDLDIVTSTSEATGLVESLWATVPDVVLLATDVPGMDAVSVCADVADALPVCRTLLVAPDGLAPYAAVAAGARGVVSRAELAAQPGRTVRQVARGEAFVPQPWAEALLRDFESSSGPRLSATEREVLLRLAKGSASDSIAALHEVPPRLVRLHAGYALSKVHLQAYKAGVAASGSAS